MSARLSFCALLAALVCGCAPLTAEHPLFAPGDQVLVVRLTGGNTVAYPLKLLEGTELLDRVRGLGLAPLTDDETREIYDIRQRLSRQPSYGALSLASHGNV